MFDSALRRGAKTGRGRWIACIIGVSVFHVLIIALVTGFSRVRTFSPGGRGDDSRPVTFMAGPPPPKGSPAPRQQAARPKPKPRPEPQVPRQPDVQVAQAAPVVPEEPEVQEGAEVNEDGSTDQIGAEDGVEGGDPNSQGVGGSGGVYQFGPGMTPPEQLSGRDPEYTRPALEARVEGTMVVRCVVTVEGRVQNCRPVKSLPYMDDAVIEALLSRKYRPATYQGRPIAVDYVFTVRLVLPKY